MEVKDLIRQKREELGLTYEQLGNIIGVGKSTVRKWELGMIENIKRDNIIALAKALNISPATIMGWDVETTDMLKKDEKELLSNYNKLNTKGKDKLIDYSNDLVENPKYTYEEPETFAAHSKENGDIEGNNRDIEKIKKLIMEDKSH
jgi:transcriptional regulator with XRE-family HTH domain